MKLINKHRWVPTAATLSTPWTWGVPGLAMMGLLIYMVWGYSGGSGGAGAESAPGRSRDTQAAAPLDKDGAYADITPEAADVVLAAPRVEAFTQALMAIQADIAASRADPCSSPVSFVLMDGAWRIGTRGIHLEIDAEHFPEGWTEALAARARMGFTVIHEVDLLRAEGTC